MRLVATLPATATCTKCGAAKPIIEIVCGRSRADGRFWIRHVCKLCYNARERLRRPWKREYLRRWRERNPDLNRLYYQAAAERNEVRLREQRLRRYRKDHAAYLVMSRLRTRGIIVPIAEARELVLQYGPAYPTFSGLSPEGRQVVERWRSRLRWRGLKMPRWRIVRKAWETPRYRLPVEQQPRMIRRNYRAISRRFTTRKAAAA